LRLVLDSGPRVRPRAPGPTTSLQGGKSDPSMWLSRLLLITVIISVVPEGHSVIIRGLERSLVPLYDPGKDFTCLDGSLTIPFEQINDDYCDCADGSDEPGTSACPNGKFFCRNGGHVAHYVLSSRVNDGICDCCDGTDESEGACQDVCLELGAEMRAQREQERLAAEKGYAVRQQMVGQAELLLAETRSSIATKEQEVEELKKSVELKRAEKEAAEAPEKEALDRYAEEEERQKQAKEEADKQADVLEALGAMGKMDKNGDGKVTRDEVMADLAFDTNNDGMVGDEEADFYMAEHAEYDKDTFVATAWSLMKPVIKGVDNLKPLRNTASKKRKVRDPDAPKAWNEAGQEVDEEGVPIEDSVDIDKDEEDDGGEHEEYDDYDLEDEEEGELEENGKDEDLDEDDGGGSPDPPADPSKKYDDATQTLVDIADRARNAYDEASNKLRDLERELRDLKDVANGDYGEQNEFLPLKGQCFEFRNNEYIYKLCPFDSCSQRGINGGSETRMGTWDRWEGPIPDTFSRMKYSNGQTCWNGPPRSTLVKLMCGTENVVESVTEPNRCEYEMVFSTPVICKSPEHYKDKHDEL